MPLDAPHPAHVIAHQHVAVVQLGAVNHRRIVGELDFLEDVAGLDIEAEKAFRLESAFQRLS